LSFANSTIIAAHKVSAAREPIGIAEKRLQLTSKFSKNASSFNISFFRKEMCAI